MLGVAVPPALCKDFEGSPNTSGTITCDGENFRRADLHEYCNEIVTNWFEPAQEEIHDLPDHVTTSHVMNTEDLDHLRQ